MNFTPKAFVNSNPLLPAFRKIMNFGGKKGSLDFTAHENEDEMFLYKTWKMEAEIQKNRFHSHNSLS